MCFSLISVLGEPSLGLACGGCGQLCFWFGVERRLLHEAVRVMDTVNLNCFCCMNSYAGVLGAGVSQCLCVCAAEHAAALEHPFLLLGHAPDNPNQVTNAGDKSRVSCVEGARKLSSEQEPITLAMSIAGGQYIMELEGYPL